MLPNCSLLHCLWFSFITLQLSPMSDNEQVRFSFMNLNEHLQPSPAPNGPREVCLPNTPTDHNFHHSTRLWWHCTARDPYQLTHIDQLAHSLVDLLYSHAGHWQHGCSYILGQEQFQDGFPGGTLCQQPVLHVLQLSHRVHYWIWL